MSKKITAMISVLVIAEGMSACGSTGDNTGSDTDKKTEENVRVEQSFTKLDEGVYSLEYTDDYKLEEFISANIKDVESFDKWLTDNLTNGVPTESGSAETACSCFFTEDSEGKHILGRNYDMLSDGGVMVHTKPESGYESIAIADISHMNLGEHSDYSMDSDEAKSLLNASPYCISDGLNEKGLSVSLLTIDTQHTPEDTDKGDMLIYSSMRAVLDKCADVDEAVKFLEGYGMFSPGNHSYHLFLNDKGGNSAVIEWAQGETYVVSGSVATNIMLNNCDNPEEEDYRYAKLFKRINDGTDMSKEDATLLLADVSQRKATAWSAVYDLDNFKVEACFDTNYKQVYTFPE